MPGLKFEDGSVQCAGCNRVIYQKDADRNGKCVYCRPASPVSAGRRGRGKKGVAEERPLIPGTLREA
jgi:hypothetical protein